MATNKKVERLYSMEDLLMLELAQVFHNNFVIDEAEFIAAFPFFVTPFAADFQTAIDDADAIPSGAEVDSLITVITTNLEAKLELGRNALQKLYTYVDFAYNSKEMTNTFGKDRYLKARRSQLKLKELLELAHRQAEDAINKAALLAVGYTQAMIDELETLVDEIDDLNAQQEDALSVRGRKTAERIIAYNAVWEFMEKINKASKVVYADLPAKMETYLLYPTVHHGLSKVQNLSIIIDGGPPLMAMLNWDLVQDATEYEVQQSEVPVGQPPAGWNQIASTIEHNWNQIIAAGNRLWFRVRAKNNSQVGAFSDEEYIEP